MGKGSASRGPRHPDQTLLDLDELISLRLQTITGVASRVHAKLGKSSSWPTIRTEILALSQNF